MVEVEVDMEIIKEEVLEVIREEEEEISEGVELKTFKEEALYNLGGIINKEEVLVTSDHHFNKIYQLWNALFAINLDIMLLNIPKQLRISTESENKGVQMIKKKLEKVSILQE